MKNFFSKKTLIVLAIVSVILIVVYLLNPKLSGFVVLPANEDDIEKQQDAFEDVKPKSSKEQPTKSFQPVLSYEILKPTKLAVALLPRKKVSFCPEYSEFLLTIKNVGAYKAEAITVKPSKNISVKNCFKCKIKLLKPKDFQEVKLSLCKPLNDPESFLMVKAVNSKLIRLKMP